jgi:hypothetical protein
VAAGEQSLPNLFGRVQRRHWPTWEDEAGAEVSAQPRRMHCRDPVTHVFVSALFQSWTQYPIVE